MRTWCIVIVFIMLACSDEHTTTVSGTVVNWGSKAPVGGVSVGLMDGVGPSGMAGLGLQSSTSAKSITITDEEGKFSLTVKGEYTAFLGLGKAGYDFDSDWNDGISIGARGYEKGNHHDEVLEIKRKISFNPIFKKKSTTLDADSVFIDLLSDEAKIQQRVDVFRKYSYSGDGPYLGNAEFRFPSSTSVGRLVTADAYLRYLVKFKKGGQWIIQVDSIFIKSDNLYRDTILF